MTDTHDRLSDGLDHSDTSSTPRSDATVDVDKYDQMLALADAFDACGADMRARARLGVEILNDEDVAEAKRRMAQYQRERAERVRAETAQARRDGTAETFSDIARAQPLRVVVILVAIALLLGLMALPAILIGL